MLSIMRPSCSPLSEPLDLCMEAVCPLTCLDLNHYVFEPVIDFVYPYHFILPQ